MKKVFCAVFAIIATIAAIALFVACQPVSSVSVDDNGVKGIGYGSIYEPTTVAHLPIDAETGRPISGEPCGAFELADG